MDCSTPGFPVNHQLSELAQTHVHRVGDAIQPSHPLPSPSPPAFNLTQHQGLFQWVSSCIRLAKYWSFNFSISPSNEYSGLISFRIDWSDLLVVQGTLRSLLLHHSSKASILWHSTFFTVQLSDTMDCSPPGSSVRGISQARIPKWLPFPSTGDLLGPRIKLAFPALAGGFFTTEPSRKSLI